MILRRFLEGIRVSHGQGPRFSLKHDGRFSSFSRDSHRLVRGFSKEFAFLTDFSLIGRVGFSHTTPAPKGAGCVRNENDRRG